jgi:hypothetical protein
MCFKKIMMNKERKTKDFIKKIVFWRTFQDIIDKETSSLSKFVLQQNLIFFQITQVLISLKLAINGLLLTGSLEKRITNSKKILRIKIPYPKELLKTKTLGQLIHLFEQLAPPDADKVIKLLNTYNSKRNDLVHKIFLKYDNERDVHKDANKIIKIGEKVLNELRRLEIQFNNIWKENHK